MSDGEDIEAARARAQVVVKELGEKIDAFVAAAGPGSTQRKIQAALTGKPMVLPIYKRGQKLDPGPVIAKIQAQLIPFACMKLLIRLMLFIKETCPCASSPDNSNP